MVSLRIILRLRAPAVVVALAASTAIACEEGSTPVFSCEASNGRKFIELCAASPPSLDGFLEYRFGSLGRDGQEKAVELVFPAQREGSLAQFFGATYTSKGVYAQSVRFGTGSHAYTVFTRARGSRDQGAGVEVKARASGKVTTIYCSERPRFYVFELQGLLACDPETPVGKACIR